MENLRPQNKIGERLWEIKILKSTWGESKEKNHTHTGADRMHTHKGPKKNLTLPPELI